MHYSDCYKFISKLKDKQFARQLKQQLKELEKSSNEPSFIKFLKLNKTSNKDIFALRSEYDLAQLEKVITGILLIIGMIGDPKQKKDCDILQSITTVLTQIKETAERQKKDYKPFVKTNHYYQLAQKYATHYLPFKQANDPFKGPDWEGYCFGHTHRYGKLISKNRLEELSQSSNKKVYETFKRQETFSDIIFRLIGFYYHVQSTERMQEAIWHALKDMDDKTIVNFNFLATRKNYLVPDEQYNHSIGIRMVGNEIEYYESNYGLVRFNTREDAVKFLAEHLLKIATAFKGKIDGFHVYKLPYKNDPTQDIWQDLSYGKIEKEQSPVPLDQVKHSDELKYAIQALRAYGEKLNGCNNVKGKIKANEIYYLVSELDYLSADQVRSRVRSILTNKDHSLMLNRGTGFYFFASGLKSHSTTETLLQAIYKVTEPSAPVLGTQLK